MSDSCLRPSSVQEQRELVRPLKAEALATIYYPTLSYPNSLDEMATGTENIFLLCRDKKPTVKVDTKRLPTFEVTSEAFFTAAPVFVFVRHAILEITFAFRHRFLDWTDEVLINF